MDPETRRMMRYSTRVADKDAGSHSVGEALSEYLDRGKRLKSSMRGDYRVRSPTNSERLNRALVELGLSAFKVHLLIWKWRGAPARGTLPFFTIRSLEKFCHLTRPTVRVALRELVLKGWINRKKYNKHHKNTLYSLVPIRKVPAPYEEHSKIREDDTEEQSKAREG